MIKRHYFVAARKLHGDGSGSYSYTNFTATITSLLAKPEIVYTEAREAAQENLKAEKGSFIEIMAFNRI